MRIFLDANILFSASRSAGAIRQLLELAEVSGHVLIADTYVAGEARRNVASKAPGQPAEVLEALLGRITVQPFQPGTRGDVDLDWLDAKDRPVLLAAMSARCDVLVTGDKRHFGQAYGLRHGGVLVCSALQLFALLQKGETA